MSRLGPHSLKLDLPGLPNPALGPYCVEMINDRRKQSLYFADEMLDDIKSEAARMDRSVSWVVQKAWKIARNQVMAMPSANDPVGSAPASEPKEGDPR